MKSKAVAVIDLRYNLPMSRPGQSVSHLQGRSPENTVQADPCSKHSTTHRHTFSRSPPPAHRHTILIQQHTKQQYTCHMAHSKSTVAAREEVSTAVAPQRKSITEAGDTTNKKKRCRGFAFNSSFHIIIWMEPSLSLLFWPGFHL